MTFSNIYILTGQKAVTELFQPNWIADNQTLTEVCSLWQGEAYLAVDTEFVRTATFYPKAGLIQITSSHGDYLIDPLAIDDWQPLREIFEHPLIVKVFHACAEDLEVCRQLVGCVPSPLADSQHAAALAGLGGSMGFQRLVSAVLGIDLPKGETRSNWLERPLREEQVQYAVADVHYLYRLYPKLIAQLKKMERESWLAEDCQRLVDQAKAPEVLADYYRRVKLAWKLRAQEQFVLQQLVVWREQQARERDVPRNKVVDDNTLWNLARYKAKNHDQLIRSGMKPPAARHDGKSLLKIIEQALAIENRYWPKQLDKPLSPQAGQTLKDLKKVIAAKAELLNIPTDVLVKKKALEALLRSGMASGKYSLPESLAGWRKAEIADELVLALTEVPAT